MTYSDPGQPPQGPQSPYGQPPQSPPPQGPPPQGPPPSQPYGMNPASSGENPGKNLGLVGMILSIVGCIGCTALAGIIVSIVGLVKSKKAGMGNGMAIAGIIIGVLWLVGLSIGGGVFFNQLNEKCEELGPGTHEVGNVTYQCGPQYG